MDPVSVITIVSWATQSALTLYDFVDTIRKAPEEVTLLSRETHAFYSVLRQLKTALEDPVIKAYIARNPALRDDLTSLGEPLRLCDRRVGELMRTLADCTELRADGSRNVKMVKWYFVRGDVLAAKSYLADIRDVVTFAMTNNNFMETLRTNAGANGSLGVPPQKDGGRTPSPVLEDRIKELQRQGSSLRRAARDGDNRAIELLLDAGVPVDSKSFEGRTAMSHAAEHGNTETVRLLLDRGANVRCVQNTIDGNRWKRAESRRLPLHWAAAKGHAAVCALLLDAGADVDAPTASQRTALQEAGMAGHLTTVMFLLERGADVNTRTYYGWTLLHTAATDGKIELANLLLKRGANTEAVYSGRWHGEGKCDDNATQQRPLHYAVRPLRRLPADETAMVELLVKGGAKISAPDSAGSTPLHYAVRRGSKAVVSVLLRYGTREDVQTKSSAGITPLDYAMEAGDREMIEILSAR